LTDNINDVSKRTTVTLEDDVVRRLHSEARRTGRSFKEVLNEAVRLGLDRALKPTTTEFHVQPRDMGLLPGLALDDISSLLEQVEGGEHR
jgi:Ribbon-helix-helix protein, copG family